MARLSTFAIVAAVLVCASVGTGCGEDERESTTERFRAEVKTAELGDTEVAYYERGEGEPLVMLVGTGSTMAEWDPALLELLAEDHRLILLDYPGLGMSGHWRGDSFSSLAQTTVDLLDHLEIPRAAILGWSMGGFVAQRIAIEHPERVSALVLAGTNPGSPQAVLGTPEAQAIDSDPDPSDAQILTLLYPTGEQDEGRRFLERLVTASQSGEIPDDFDVPAKTTDRQVAAEDPWLRSSDNLDELATIEAPTLAAAGRSDPVTPAENMRLIASRIDGAELAVLPGAHAFLFQSREEFASDVAELTRANP
jgi:pimeloyl-ACP methyl ester carboxylesterase